jgi:hypothetical protein
MRESDARPSYTQVNRNLCNFPLARDGHVRAQWCRSKKTGRLWCELPGEGRIRLRLAANADSGLRRCPTGCDVAVLLVLLRAAHVRKATSVEYASVAAIMREMGLEPAQRHRRAVTDALALWSALGIIHDAWYEPGRKKARRVLPPPICGIDKSPRRMQVRLSPDWCDLAACFYVRVPHRLPLRAPLQNLILWLLTAPNNHPDPDSRGRMTQKKRRRQLCRIIGVNHGTRNRVLAGTIAAAARWFEAQGGSLDYLQEGEHVVFMVHDPKHRRARKPSVARTRSKRAEATPRPAPGLRAREQAPDFESFMSFMGGTLRRRTAKLVRVPGDGDEHHTMHQLSGGETVDELPEGYRLIGA